MNNNIQTLTISFFALLLIQFFVLNSFQFTKFIIPYFYLIFIVLFPVNINKLIFLIIAFLMGFIVDLLTYSFGVHAFTCVLVAYMRTPILKIFAGRAELELKEITVESLSIIKFLVFSSILVFIHHLIVFHLELFSFKKFFITTFQSIVSSFFTLLVFMFHQLLTGKIK